MRHSIAHVEADDHRSPRDDPDISGGDLYDLLGIARVAGWELFDLHNLANVSWVGFVPY